MGAPQLRGHGDGAFKLGDGLTVAAGDHVEVGDLLEQRPVAWVDGQGPGFPGAGRDAAQVIVRRRQRHRFKARFGDSVRQAGREGLLGAGEVAHLQRQLAEQQLGVDVGRFGAQHLAGELLGATVETAQSEASEAEFGVRVRGVGSQRLQIAGFRVRRLVDRGAQIREAGVAARIRRRRGDGRSERRRRAAHIAERPRRLGAGSQVGRRQEFLEAGRGGCSIREQPAAAQHRGGGAVSRDGRSGFGGAVHGGFGNRGLGNTGGADWSVEATGHVRWRGRRAGDMFDRLAERAKPGAQGHQHRSPRSHCPS